VSSNLLLFENVSPSHLASGDGKTQASEAEEAIHGRVSVNLGQIESTKRMDGANFNLSFRWLSFAFTRSIIGRPSSSSVDL